MFVRLLIDSQDELYPFTEQGPSQLRPDWQHSIKASHKSAPEAGLRFLLVNYVAALNKYADTAPVRAYLMFSLLEASQNNDVGERGLRRL